MGTMIVRHIQSATVSSRQYCLGAVALKSQPVAVVAKTRSDEYALSRNVLRQVLRL